MPSSRTSSYIWVRSERNTGNVRLLVEEGHDFFLEGEEDSGGSSGSGSRAICVLARGGLLLAGDRLVRGDRVEVIGFVDRIVEPEMSSHHPRGEPMAVALRSSDELPLLLRKITALESATP
jgi:hypothetical protein